MAITWFKLHHDLPGHYKLRKLSPQQKWAWVTLLCLASSSKERGTVSLKDQESLADYCDFECLQDFQFFLDKLRQKGLIEPIEGGIKICSWEERQYDKPSDRPKSVKERVAKHRAKKKAEKLEKDNVTVTPCNAKERDVTPEKRPVTDRLEETREEEIRLDQNSLASLVPEGARDDSESPLDLSTPSPGENNEENLETEFVAANISIPQSSITVIDSSQSATPVRHPEEFEPAVQQQKGKSSAPRRMTDADVLALGMEYNRCRPDKWAKFRGGMTVSGPRFEAMSYLWEYSGWDLNSAKEILGCALMYARLHPFFSGQAKSRDGRFFEKRNLNFVLKQTVFEEWSEAFESMGASMESILSSGLSDAELQQGKKQFEQKHRQESDPVMEKMRAYGWVA